ncbi:sialidase family protein [Methylomicrobium sp. Wu6]|uniref:sialidase family protein n=1 Tax=Methylomicrobium sp. Wu6 TaxID=3107928 RepID=UPI002DD68DD2|nr:sialidase family protein [Methylomicrobium sp. Wu6]MEC4748516.1 sialidase family protein [Methylomicrobium sp. Wu6]
MRQPITGEPKRSLSIPGLARQRTSALVALAWASLCLFAAPTTVAAPVPALSVQDMEAPSPVQSSQAHLSAGSGGKLILSWVEPGKKSRKTLKFALYDGKAWTAPRDVVSLPAIYDLPKVIELDDGAFGAVWGTLAESKKQTSNEVYVAHSADGGLTWSQPVKANSDRKVKTARYNANIAPLPEGRMAVFWSDARHRKKDRGTQYLMGAVMETKGQVEHDFAVDDDICSCCQLLPIRYKDQLYVTYRDRLPGEVRDIAVLPWPGIQIAKPVRVHPDNWVLDGCPGQNVGAAASANRLGVAWFTAAGGKGKVQAAFAGDPGKSFSAPIDVDPKHQPQGEVKMAMIDDDHALVQWIRTTPEGPSLQAALVSASGQVLAERELSKPNWETGFEWPNLPTLAEAGGNAYFSWLDTQAKRIRLLKIGL